MRFMRAQLDWVGFLPAIGLMCASGPFASAQTPKLSGPGMTPASAPSALRTARSLEEANRFAEAEQTLRVYLRNDDGSGEAHELLAYALLRQNKPKDSLQEYTRAAALERPTSTMLVHVGQAYALLNDDADADKWTLRAIEENPKDADAWYGLGRIRYSEQRFPDALSCFQHVLLLVPRSVKAENNLGLAYEALNQPDAATAAYRQAIAWQNAAPAAERSEQPLLNLATMLLHHDKLEEAQQLLLEAEGIAPSNPQIHEQLGHLASQKGDFAAAQQEFARACELEPNESSVHFLLGQAYKHLGRQREAEAEFETASRLAKNGASPTQP